MAKLTDFDFYAARVTSCETMAQQAVLPEVRAIHMVMANRYRRLCADLAPTRGQPPASVGAAQPAVQVVLVESGHLYELDRV